MPNRMLRDWTLSDKINSLNVHAERFFIRLIMKVDDHGCFYADHRILKANLYPLLSDVIREADIVRWMAECQKADVIVLYESEGKKYLQIKDFRQRLDKAKSKFPMPLEINPLTNSNDSLPIVNEFPAELERNTEVEVEPEPKGGEPPAHTKDQIELFKKFCDWIKTNAPSVAKLVEPFTVDQFLKLKADFTSPQIQEMLMKMHNYKPLLTKNKSAYLTFKNWAAKDFNSNQASNEQATGNSLNERIKEAQQVNV